jgi:hypothetical protein
LLPTPSAVSYGTNHGGAAARVGPVRPSLETMARHELWPTPKPHNRNSRKALTQRHFSAVALAQAVELRAGILPREFVSVEELSPMARAMWPTPTAGDASGSGNRNGATSKAHPGVSLTDAVLTGGSSTPRREVTGQLNPTWVEWLMGYPLGWTVCEDWATASSRRSRNGSRTESRRPK